MLEGLPYPDTAGCEPDLGVETNLEGRLRGVLAEAKSSAYGDLGAGATARVS